MKISAFAKLSLFSALIALSVIMLGAFVRLSDAGLGCPDWPGCYGRLGVPTQTHEIEQANAAYPERPVESAKAWKEMLHRYLAGTLGLLILFLTGWAWYRRSRSGFPVALPSILLGLVIFQALLGMWTVTLLVKPFIVTAHLLGGLATLALLWWLGLRHGRFWLEPLQPKMQRLRPWAWLGLLLLLGQVFLGGWTSTNYAALACNTFPQCQAGQWWPQTDFNEAFVLWRGLGVNYEFGVLDAEARTAIHLSHRIGALIVGLYLFALGLMVALRADRRVQRNLGLAILTLLCLQIALGISNVVAHLPLPIAVAHNGGAALLMLGLLALIHALSPIENRLSDQGRPSSNKQPGEQPL